MPAAAAELAWKQTPSTLALLDGKTVVWQFHYAKGESKPYFHPLTVAGSLPLTDFRPPDHPWHRAFWFSWKLIDGLNYWEEYPKTGRSAGDHRGSRCGRYCPARPLSQLPAQACLPSAKQAVRAYGKPVDRGLSADKVRQLAHRLG